MVKSPIVYALATRMAVMIPIHHEDYKIRQIVSRAVEDAQYRYAVLSSQWQSADIQFEVENNCKIVYDRNQHPVMLVFDDEDWFWFKAKWLTE